MKRTKAQRRRDRAAGVDVHGNPLPRTRGTNPKAVRARAEAKAATAAQDRP